MLNHSMTHVHVYTITFLVDSTQTQRTCEGGVFDGNSGNGLFFFLSPHKIYYGYSLEVPQIPNECLPSTGDCNKLFSP